MPGYSENQFLDTSGSTITIGGPATTHVEVPPAAMGGGFFASATSVAGPVFSQASFPFPRAATVRSLILIPYQGAGSYIHCAGVVVRMARHAGLGLGASNVGAARERILEITLPSVISSGDVFEVAANGGAGFEVNPGDLVFVYGLAKAVVTGVATVDVSLVYSTREVAPASWAGGFGSYPMPVPEVNPGKLVSLTPNVL